MVASEGTNNVSIVSLVYDNSKFFGLDSLLFEKSNS